AVDDLLFGSSDGLQFNPAPRYDFDNGYSMKSWQIAQQHPLLARNVSDFVVQFAADADNDGVIDRDSDGDGAPDNSATAPDPIVWYDIDNPLVAGFNYDNGDWGGSGNSTVPGYTAYTPQDTTVDLDGDTGSSNDETLYVWRHDDDTVVDAGGDDIIDSSEATNSKWPFLIRLRWRVHDEKGALDHSLRIQDTGDADGDGSTTDYIWVRDDGVWFEQIVRVPRPMP
ncbi:MAG: hypothetical protein R3336_00450, partial [Phycisphaeraceae bacterium]|nr:hypothetical protein [Phycisphaeraceae bacterium]